MRKNLLLPLAVSLLFLATAYGQEKAESPLCADLPGLTSGIHRFRYVGETIEIPIRGDGVPASVADCEPLALEVRWANGRNNGSNFTVSFLDGNKRPIYTKYLSGFMAGVVQYPLSSFDQPMYGSSLTMISVPSTVTIQAGEPVAAPASLSYTVTRVARPSKKKEERKKGEAEEDTRQGNEIVSVHNAVRLIGASRLPLVQMELKTSRPFPVRDMPLQLQIGKKVFIDELSGDYTGRKLTLSLTPEMFAELKDGDDIVAFFSKPDGNGSADQDVWNFGKLSKAVSSREK
jgi:hypothetical protein